MKTSYLVFLFLLMSISLSNITYISLLHFKVQGNVFKVNFLNQDLNFQFNLNFVSLPRIDYSDAYYNWFNPKIDMLILTPNRYQFLTSIQPLMKWKNEIGLKSIILNNFSEYEGKDNAEKVRNLIKDYYKCDNIK
ncbi:MAG: hypothetical protein KGD61_07550 [Candidatus Lokiarchaeota archaeon]|nr:hypothetical protein [Candidatus Lokiarchaeota archaeon]